MALLEWQTGIVTRIEQATPNTRRFWIEIPKQSSFDFKPGQFITLDLPIHEQRNRRWRSYSIASAPDGTNTVELVISYVEDGLGTNYLFNDMTVGTELNLRGPQGVFVLPGEVNKDMFFICTGTGIAPFRSMLHHIHTHNLSHKAIYLLCGARVQTDLLYREEMEMLQQNIPSFQYIPTLSREDWEGNKGYVHTLYESLCKGRQPANFMLCGWKNMIDEAKTRILQMGYDKKDVYLELYG